MRIKKCKICGGMPRLVQPPNIHPNNAWLACKTGGCSLATRPIKTKLLLSPTLNMVSEWNNYYGERL